MMTLLPRLPSLAAKGLLEDFLETRKIGGFEFRFDRSSMPDTVRYAATGGSPVDFRKLRNIRQRIYATAVECGMDGGHSRSRFARFDRSSTILLGTCNMFSSGEALRDDVWNFVGVVLAPDIVYWRFGESRLRYTGGVRNAFQRLWLRGKALDRGANEIGRWELVSVLPEDAFVQITERPSISADRTLAVALGEAWIRAAVRFGKARMEPIMRSATIRIRLLNEIRSLSSLDASDLGRVLDTIFDKSAEGLGVRRIRQLQDT